MTLKTLIVGILVVAVSGSAANGFADDSNDAVIMELKAMIEKQQEQLNLQQQQIETLMNQVEAMTAEKATETPAPQKAKDAPENSIRAGGDKIRSTIYAQVNRGVLYVNDGNTDELIPVDNDHSSTRIGIVGSAKMNSDISVGTKIEVQFESNSSSKVSQDNQSGVGPNNFTERHLDLFLKSEKMGKLSIGQGSTASDGTSEVDLSGTKVISKSDQGDFAGGIKFFDRTTDALSGLKIGAVVNNMDGLSRRDRLRYDTPTFGGFTLSGSVTERKQQDLALRYKKTFPGFKLSGAIAYENLDASATISNQYNGSISVLLNSGLNATIAAGYRDMIVSARKEPAFYYFKLGYRADFFSAGKTSFAIDYGRFNDIAQNDDQADTIGIVALQNLNSLATDLYIGYRFHSLDRPGSRFDDINAILTGARIKF
ncbi:MAG: porin [Desulfobacterales bacterium]